MYGQGYGSLLWLYFCFHGKCDTSKRRFILGSCKVQFDVGYTCSLSPTLFPDSVLSKAEEDIGKSEDRGWSHTQSQSGDRTDSRYHPYRRLYKQSQNQRSGKPSWKTLGHYSKKTRWYTCKQVLITSGQGSVSL